MRAATAATASVVYPSEVRRVGDPLVTCAVSSTSGGSPCVLTRSHDTSVVPVAGAVGGRSVTAGAPRDKQSAGVCCGPSTRPGAAAPPCCTTAAGVGTPTTSLACACVRRPTNPRRVRQASSCAPSSTSCGSVGAARSSTASSASRPRNPCSSSRSQSSRWATSVCRSDSLAAPYARVYAGP